MPRSRIITILSALMLVALGLHLWGIEFGVPCWIEDDPHVAQHVEYLRSDKEEAVFNRAVQYPLVLPGLTLMLPSLKQDAAGLRTTADHLRQASYAFFEVRRAVALFSILLIPLTYLLAKRFVPVPWALGAAAMIAFSLLEHSFAQQARPHGLAVVLYTLAMLSYLRLARTPTWGSYILAGLTTALSIGVLHSGFAVCIPCLVAHLVRGEEPRRFFTLKAWIPPLCALAALPLFYPFFFEHGAGTEYGQLKLYDGGIQFADHEIDWAALNGGGFLVVMRTLRSFEPALLATLGLGLLALCFRGALRVAAERIAARRELLIVLAFVVPYLGAIGLFERTYERFVLPLLPYGAVLAAWGLWQLTSSALPKFVSRAVVALAVLGFGVQAAACARLSWLRSRPSTTDLAAEFLAAQPGIREQAIYLWPSIDVPLARIAKDPTGKRRLGGQPTCWSEYLARLAPERVPEPRYDVRFFVKRDKDGWTLDHIAQDLRGFLDVLGPGWYVVNRSYNPSGTAVDALPDLLRREGRVAFHSEPDPGEGEPRFRLQYQDEMLHDVPNWTLWLLRAERVGPVLEIIRVE